MSQTALPGVHMKSVRFIALSTLLLFYTSSLSFRAQAEAAAESAREGAEGAVEPVSAAKTLPSLDEILQRTDEDSENYTERCISTREIRTRHVLDAQHLILEMRNNMYYLVQFPRRCSGLRRGDPISYQTQAGRLCKLDSIRPLEFRGRGLEPGVPCYIPEFQQVSLEQIDYLKEAMKAERAARKR